MAQVQVEDPVLKLAARTDRDFGRLVETTVSQIESGLFASHGGIRFPQSLCPACPHLGLCLDDRKLIDVRLIRKPGASDLDWLDEFAD